MISISLHGLVEHLAFLATVLLVVAAPVVAYFMGRRDGTEITDDAWSEFLADCDCGSSDG